MIENILGKGGNAGYLFPQSFQKAFLQGRLNKNSLIKSRSDRTEALWENEKMLITSIFSFSHRFLERILVRVVKTGAWVVKG